MMHDPSLMHTRIRLCSSETCMHIATAKLPGLITTFLILPHPILTAIACPLHIIMNGHPQCSSYATVLMLLHVIISFWSHPCVLMMGRSQEHSTSVGQKTLFVSKPSVTPIFCVIVPSIYRLTNKLL
jgi:hypothetical protein